MVIDYEKYQNQNGKRELRDAGADYIAADVRELRGILLNVEDGE